jgi:5-methylcytosine-specific restriction endonuclease McrA
MRGGTMRGDGFYQSPAWRALRKATLTANPLCSVPGCGVASRHVDHRVARSRGGASLDPANLVALCHPHHSEKTARVDGGFGNQRGGEATLRAKGCDLNGWPLDPSSHWHAK